MHSECLSEIKVYLKDVLVQEKLSCSAEKERLRLLRYLDSRETSPAPYLDMSPNSKNSKIDRDKTRTNNECYEEFSSGTNYSSSNENNFEKDKDSNSKTSSARSSTSLYYNIPQTFRTSSSWDINDDRPAIPQKDQRNSYCNSCTTSNRNSMCNLTTIPTIKPDSDTTDSVSEASSSTSNNCSSKFATASSSPEVLTISASALRYSASKCGLLNKKEKFFFLDHYKQYWVGLLGHVLYVYTNDKDSKPILELDIEGYQARPVGLKDSPKKENSFEIFCPGNKTYQFTASSVLEMDQWISAICQAGKLVENTSNNVTKLEQTPHRQLPSLPAELTYDLPDSAIRPVTPRSPEQYEIMNSSMDDVFYHYISNDTCSSVPEDVLYKNLEEVSIISKDSEEKNMGSCNENVYYNLVPADDEEQERIYDTIRETDQGEKTLPVPVPVSGRIQQIIQKIEAQASTVGSKRTSLIQDELYEPVNSPEEKDVMRTVSR